MEYNKMSIAEVYNIAIFILHLLFRYDLTRLAQELATSRGGQFELIYRSGT